MAAALVGQDRPARRRRNSLRTFAAFGGRLLLIAAAMLSLAIGSRSLPLSTVVNALFHDDGSTASSVIWDVRVPRTLAGSAAGVALGVAGLGVPVQRTRLLILVLGTAACAVATAAAGPIPFVASSHRSRPGASPGRRAPTFGPPPAPAPSSSGGLLRRQRRPGRI
ncbi:iron chelate uptake ABC transporter family permease subunit [Streptomyces sp. WM6386]|uniref:iron chelate uptake ABC transporter family permease subunit n=1 Tax=Streptomyces sp. WM6386 TaxID=1415558 RepID=UPI001F37489F|nr:iron chelate uptake ABC transporter family permease subunit [Streptomyces sp. WM6386]